MACPFMRRVESLPRQPSVADQVPWTLEDDLSDHNDDALALTHLNAAIQLLTGPSVMTLCYSKKHYINLFLFSIFCFIVSLINYRYLIYLIKKCNLYIFVFV